MNADNQYTENWKNAEVSQKQLELNLRQLSSRESYPAHWLFFLNFISGNKISSVLDIGCGVGSYAALLKLNAESVDYAGIDYSESAISIAKSKWDFGEFFCMDYKELTSEFVCKYDVVHLGAFLDVMPNGDEVLEFIFSLKPNKILISRIECTKEASHFTTYNAYDTITTYSYKHNRKGLVLMAERHGYEIEFLENNIFLKKNTIA